MASRTDRPNMLITVLCAMLSALVVIGFGRLAYGVILPSMRADLGLSYQQAGMLSTVTALSYVCFVLAGGLESLKLLESTVPVDWAAIVAGVVVSAVAAYACIALFLGAISRMGFMPFVIYRLALGVFLLVVFV